MLEAHMTHMGRLFHRRHRIKHLLSEDSVARKGIDGKVTDAKRGQVLEEVRTL